MLKKIAILFASCLLILIILALPTLLKMPFPDGDYFEYQGLIGLNDGKSTHWIVPTDNGVVLIDTGMDPQSERLKSEIAGRPVLAILMTHAHFDHTGGINDFGNVPVYIAGAERELLMGKKLPEGKMARFSTKLMGATVPESKDIREFSDGVTVTIDGAEIRMIHTPGHTLGSAMYIWNDVLFSGDTLVGKGDHVAEIPAASADRFEQIPASVAKLLQYDFKHMADGHVGFHKDVRKQVEDYVANNFTVVQ